MRVVRYFTTDGQFIALVVNEGRKWMHVILMDSAGIRVSRVKLTEAKWMEPIDYPVKKAARKFLAAGRAFGITGSARKALKEV